MALKSYFLGCPFWTNDDWLGTLYSKGCRAADQLAEYVQVFNTVEGNQTFYGLPRASTISRWQELWPEGFYGCFKFPRTISHDLQLLDAGPETLSFLKTIEPLHGRVGLLFLQMPPTFDAEGLGLLWQYLSALPCDYHYAVEVRHPDFEAGSPADYELNQILSGLHMNRTIFHTEELFKIENGDRSIRDAQAQKPNIRTWLKATDQRPMIRYCGHNEVEPNRRPIRKLARQVAAWLSKGKTPFVFLHSPNDVHCPALCRIFHRALAEELGANGPDIGSLPAFLGEAEPYQPMLF